VRGSNNADFLVSITVSTAIASLGAPVGIGLPNLRFGEILTVIELTVAITVIVTALSGSTPLSATPGTLGVSGFLGCCRLGVLLVSWSLFPVYARAWVMPACRGGGGVRFHGPRPRAGGAVPPFPGVVCRSGLGESGREYCDLGFPGDCGLRGAGVRELRPCFLCPLGVPLAAGQVEGVQAGAGGGIGRGGERFQR
jgi:hypothetical protein